MRRSPVSKIDEQLLLVSDWRSLPSPKIKHSDRTGPYVWTRLYTGFSERFAQSALRLLVRDSPSTVFDPFVGAGTTMVAAVRLGHKVIGVELDPVAALLSRAAVASNFDIQTVQSILKAGKSQRVWRGSDKSRSFFSQGDLQFARIVFDRLEKRIGARGTDLWSVLLSGQVTLDSEAIALAALVTAANDSAAVVRGSNPVWFRSAYPGETLGRETLQTATNRWIKKITNDVNGLGIPRPKAKILNEDFRSLQLDAASVDAVLTSPPYLNRVDYAQSHLAPIHLLTGLMAIDFEDIRDKMMGTTKMTDKPIPVQAWGPTCLATLEKIRAHSSKASSSYYFWYFTQYFRDTFLVIRTLRNVCRKGACGAVVLQNSYYKEIEIPLANIWLEMSEQFGISGALVRSEKVRQHLGTLSPSQKTWLPLKVLEEAVLLLQF